jgi:CBS domain-containing protein
MPQLALRDVMSHEFVGVSESDELLEAVELLREENTTSAVVLRGSDPVGMLTADTVLDLVLDDTDLGAVAVSDVMEETPMTLPQEASVAEAGDLMGRSGDPRVLVTDGNGGVRGVVEARDIAPAVAGRSETAGDAPTGSSSVGASGTASIEMTDAASEEYADSPAEEYEDGQPANDYAEQGVCESCGSLASELVNVNGRLLCTECRSL